MSTRFLPTREGALDTWLSNFSGLISAAPAAYGLSPAEAAVITAAVSDWHKAFEAASSPATRTQGAVAEKRVQKKHVVAVARRFAGIIRINDAVSSELKINLGLKLRARKGSPVPVPASPPYLAVHRFEQGFHELRAADAESAPRRGKPAGAAGLMVFRAIGEDPARGPQDAHFLTLVTRTTFTSTFEHAQRGLTATYFARWLNSKGEAGPWSTAMSAAIAA
jgi:hypothetical protein